MVRALQEIINIAHIELQELHAVKSRMGRMGWIGQTPLAVTTTGASDVLKPG